MPKEYDEIKASLRKAHPDWSEEELSKRAAMTFGSVFGTNPQHAEKLMSEGKWAEYMKSHSSSKSKKEDTYELFVSGVQLKEESDDDYIEGFVSTPDVDLGNDKVVCQKEIAAQLMSNSVANKLSFRHDWLKKEGFDENIAPFGRCVMSEAKEIPGSKTEGTWARYRLNKSYPGYQEKKEGIKKGFYDGFSIEYKALNTVSQKIGNALVRVIDSIKIIGVGIAARPMNPGSMLTGFTLKEYEYVEDDVESKEVWSTKYVNDLPDSCFAWVEEGEKDSEGKTVPRSKRHLPYKDSSGNVDPAHVRNALARMQQMDMPMMAKSDAMKKLHAAAKKVGVEVSEKAKKEVEVMVEESATKTAEVDYKEKFEALQKEMEAMKKELETKSAFETELKELKAKDKVLVEAKEQEAKVVDAEFKEFQKDPTWEGAKALIKKHNLF